MRRLEAKFREPHRYANFGPVIQLAMRRGHQIIITTHSAAILGQLNRKSVVYLRRAPDGLLSATTGLSTYQVDSYLQAEGHRAGKPTICVEDEFARHLTIEILRRCDPDLLAGCSLLPIGAGQDIPLPFVCFTAQGFGASASPTATCLTSRTPGCRSCRGRCRRRSRSSLMPP